MASKTEICNMAISHLGIGKEIANIETEQSQEAAACRRYFDTTLEAVLSDYDWPFATQEGVLNLIASNPTLEWDFSYRYPTDCIRLRRIKSGMRQDTTSSRVPFKILYDATGKILYTDKENAEVEYTLRLTDPTVFTSEFSIAFSFRLAAYIAPRLTGGDPFKMKSEMLQQYFGELGNAKSRSMNEERSDPPGDSEFITGRS